MYVGCQRLSEYDFHLSYMLDISTIYHIKAQELKTSFIKSLIYSYDQYQFCIHIFYLNR